MLEGTLLCSKRMHDILFFLVFSIVFLVSFGEFALLRLFFFDWFSLVLVLLQDYFLISSSINTIVFAGSFSIGRNSAEWQYSAPLIDEIKSQLLSLESLIELMGQDDGVQLEEGIARPIERTVKFLQRISLSINPKSKTEIKFFENLCALLTFFKEKEENQTILEQIANGKRVRLSREKTGNLRKVLEKLMVTFHQIKRRCFLHYCVSLDEFLLILLCLLWLIHHLNVLLTCESATIEDQM